MGQSADAMRYGREPDQGRPGGMATAGPAADETEQIEQEIEQTRAEMTATIDAIQQRLDPEQAKDSARDIADQVLQEAKAHAREVVQEAGEHAREVVRDATAHVQQAVHDATIGKVTKMVRTTQYRANEASEGFMTTLRANPIPAALAGIGLAWLYMNRESGRPPYVARSRDHVWSGSGVRRGYDYRGGDQSQSTVGQMADQAQRRAGDLAGSVGDLAGGVADQAGEYADWAADQGQWAGRRARRMVQDNPLMAGALAVTVGSAVGLLLPETRTEDEVLGKARDSLVGQAQAATQDTVEKVQRVAGEVQSTAQKEAREQGLTT